MGSVKGLILSGGRSERMGMDKSLIEYHGKPQREYLFHVLKPYCQQVHLSCKDSSLISAGLNPLQDAFKVESPLNGILTAIKHDPQSAWLTVPVDMPMINDEIIKHLLWKRDVKSFATCFYDSEGSAPEPLLCLWEPKSYASLMEFYQAGNISPRKFLQEHSVNLLAPPGRLHININTPEELQAFKRQNLQ